MELAPNEVIISPADDLINCSYTEPEDEFTGYSFSQVELPKTDSKPNKLSSKSSRSYLPMIDIEDLASSYARVRSIGLVKRIISSRHLDKQQKFVIQNTILSSLDTQPPLYNILFRHFLSVLVVLSSWILSFHLFLAVLTLVTFYLISQICKHSNFLIFTIKHTFTKVLEDLYNFEKLIDELSASLKLLTQVQMIEKATYNMKTTQQQQNIFTLNKLKQSMTDLYSNLFFDLQTKTSFLPIQNIPFDKDELICTLEREDILNRVYQEIPDNLHALCSSKMNLDTFKLWYCLLICQFGEYLHILVAIIDRNLQIRNSTNWLMQQMEIIHYGHSLRIPEHESKLNSLIQLTTWARLDLYSLNCRDKNEFPKQFCLRKDSKLETLDKIDFILQRCLLNVRNIKESELNCSVEELRSLKFCLENAIEGIKNLGKPSLLQPK